MPAPRHGEQTCPKHDCLDVVWPHVGSKRSGVTGVIVPESCGSEAVTPVPRECLGAGRDAGCLSTAGNHTQSSLYGNKAGPGAGSFGLRETQVWVFSEGTTGPLS